MQEYFSTFQSTARHSLKLDHVEITQLAVTIHNPCLITECSQDTKKGLVFVEVGKSEYPASATETNHEFSNTLEQGSHPSSNDTLP